MQTRKIYQSGNIFFTLFGAVGLVGVVGATSMTIMNGPVRSMHNVTQRTIAENNMIAAGKLALMAATNQADNGDCDADTAIEPVPFSTTGTGPFPTGGGYLPDAIGAAKQDPWGNTYGYCVWDHGAVIRNGTCPGDAGRLSGSATNEGIAVAVISSGPDRLFQTACGDDPEYVIRSPGSDDVVLAYTYEEAGALSGGLWNLKQGQPETAEIAKNLEVKGSGGDVVFGVDSATDPNRPAIKVDYIQQLSQGAVEYLSNIALGGNWLSGDGGDEGIFIDANGNVGIGTTSPSARVQVETGADTSADFPTNTSVGDLDLWLRRNNQGVEIGTAGGLNTRRSWILARHSSTHDFGAHLSTLHLQPSVGADASYEGVAIGFDPSAKLEDNGARLAVNGNVGIGTASPTHTLTVAGPMRVDNNASYDLWIQGGSATSGAGRNLAILGRKSDDRLFINHSSEYTGGTQVGGPVYISGGALNMGGQRITNLGGPSAGSDAATKGYVDTTIASELEASPGIPSGAVMAFNLNSCPPGWSALASARNRFIVGAGGTYARGATGGANTVALTVAQMPSHSHRVDPPVTYTGSAGQHSHGGVLRTGNGGRGDSGSSLYRGSPGNTDAAGSHTHSVNIPPFDSGAAGSGQAHENRPPYLALLYCQKS